MHGIHRHNPQYAGLTLPGQRGLLATSYVSSSSSTPLLSPLPTSVTAALRDEQWRLAMQEEFDALQANNTWELVPRPPRANVISGKWVFRHKLRQDGTLDRYMARWVVRGFHQRQGIDYDQTFSPVVKPATIRVVLHLAAARNWIVHQLDVKNAFLHGELQKLVYAEQPRGFVDATRPEYVCRLVKSLYGLKKAPRAWFQRFHDYVQSIGFTATSSWF